MIIEKAKCLGQRVKVINSSGMADLYDVRHITTYNSLRFASTSLFQVSRFCSQGQSRRASGQHQRPARRGHRPGRAAVDHPGPGRRKLQGPERPAEPAGPAAWPGCWPGCPPLALQNFKWNLKKWRNKTKNRKEIFFLALNTSCASVQGFFFGQSVQCGRHRSQL